LLVTVAIKCVCENSARPNAARTNVNPSGGASDYYSKFKNRNRGEPTTTENVPKVSSTMATKLDREMMHISPSSNFQNLHENVDGNVDGKDDDYEEDDYEEDDEDDEKVENKSESVISSTSRSTTTLAPVTEATTTTTTSTTTTTARTTMSTVTTSSEEEEPAPFFPTRMTTAENVEKSSTVTILPTKSATTTTTITTTTEEIEKTSTTETAKQEIEEKDKGTSLKELLRSGKYGNDPVKIKELLKNMNSDGGGADKPNDQDEVDPKDIFKKYANMAKSKTADVEVNNQ